MEAQPQHSPLSLFDPRKLDSVASANSALYGTADPYPHIVLDDLFAPEPLRRIALSFPEPGDMSIAFNNGREKKRALQNETLMSDATRLVLYQLNSGVFLDFLERLSGIEGLLPDPHFVGGGMHQIPNGGFLKIHADFNKYPRFGLERRLNLLVYLNEGWREQYGGHLELWDKTMTRCVKKVLPVFNRCVIFSTTSDSFHGHPDPITCPDGWTRKSLALYYYSNGRPEAELTESHSTLFQLRPGEQITEPEPEHKSNGLRELLKKFIPPVVLDVRNSIRKRLDA